MRFSSKIYSVLLLFLVVGVAAGCSSVEINVPLETQPPANLEDPAPSPTEKAQPDTPTPANAPASTPTTPAGQPKSRTPAISVSPRHAAVGTDVTVRLSGFPAQSPVDLGIGRVNAGFDVIAEGMTSPEGTMGTVVTIPDFVDPEDEWVMVAAAADNQVKVVSERLNISVRDQEASLQVSPRQVEVGSIVDVKARGFAPGADLKIGIGRVNSEYDIINQGKTDPDGALQTEVTIPDFVEPEDEWVIVVTSNDRQTKAVSGVLQVVSGEGEASIMVLPSKVAVGKAVEVNGAGFPANAVVELGIGRVDSEYDLVASTETNDIGAFQAQFTIPDFVDPEDRWVIVATTDEGRIKGFSETLQITE